MIRALVFDLDGTIVRFSIDYRAARADVVRALVKMGLPSSLFSVNESTFRNLERAELYVRSNGGGEEDVRRIRSLVYSIADKYELEAAKTTDLLPGVLDTLEVLRGMGLKMGIFTIAGRLSVNRVLERFQLRRFFSVVVTRDDADAIKPDPAHLRAALRGLGVDAEDVLVVGDTTWDVRCAKAAGAKAVGVTTGLSTREELLNAGADYVIDSITELPLIIRKFHS